METTVSVPDELFQRAEAMANTLGMSRDELYTLALERFVKPVSDEAITEQLNRVYDKIPSELDEGLKRLLAVSLPPERW